MRFIDQVVIITGGARAGGIGAATAKRFIEERAKVVIADILEEGKETAKALSNTGGEVEFIKTDISVLDQIKRMINFTVSKFGRLDVLVNNASFMTRSPALDISESDWDKVMDVNIKAMFFASQFAAKIMIKQGSGKIVNISSSLATRILTKRASYVTSKSAVRGLTVALACEWGKYGIRVNSIAPGWVCTQVIEEAFKKGLANKKEALSLSPMRKLSSPRDIADGIIYLASDEARLVSGHCLAIDGGSTVLAAPQNFDNLAGEELEELNKVLDGRGSEENGK